MNNVLTALCGTINFMPPWIMLGVFGAIILLTVLLIVFKATKKLIVRLIVYTLIAAMVLSYAGYICYQIALWDSAVEIIAFAIGWGPTVLFSIGVLIAVIRGLRRGLRKSLILALHAACAGAVCVAFFFIMVYVKEVDAGALKFVNRLAGENGLQSFLGVPESCSTLKEVLAAYIASFLGTGFESISPYIYTLVDMAYRIIFGILSVILFFFIDFVLYIVYVLCYSQRKYKKNKMLEFKNGKTDRSYNKHWIGGGVVGLVRGVLTGLLCLSFLGSAFYVVAGGKGEGKLEDHDFGNEDINFLYQIYRSVESYGAQGIFKILNAMTDSADTPYYLFAADLVFSGELNDEEFGISENVKFREEFAAFTGFARDTFDLLLKYGPDEVNAIVNGEASDGAFDAIVEVMTRSGFKEEFDSLIDAFDSQTYIINLSMSLVNTIVSNIDEIGFTKDAIGDGEKELIKLIFKKGFLTDNIPDERDLISETGKTEAEGSDIRPYLTVKHILNKNDVKLVLNIVLSMLAGEETGDTLELVKRIVPEISKLSILGTERKTEFNPVLARMYCLFENLYLTADGEDGARYSEMVQDGIDWVGEIHTLLDAVDDTAVIYDNLMGGEEEGEETSAPDILKSLFDEKNEHYKENMAAYDNICALLIDSRVLGRALSTNFVYKTISEALLGLSENIYIPQHIVFNNAYDKNGKLVYGETYRLLYGVKLMFGKNAELLDTLLEDGANAPIEKLLQDFAAAVEKADDNGDTLSVYLTESAILRSAISIKLIEVEGNTFYVPKAALEKVEGEYVNLITVEELKGLLDHMSALVDFVMPFVDKEDTNAWQAKFDELITQDEFYNLVEQNKIFEGTVAQMFIVKLEENETDSIVVPVVLAGVENIDGWITVDGKRGELLNLLDALRYTKFSIAGIILGGEDNEFGSSNVLKKISGMNEDELEAFFSSRVLHYTVSGYMLDENAKVGEDFVLVIPVNSRQNLKNDSIDCLVKKSELISLFRGINALKLYDDEETPEVPENPDGEEEEEKTPDDELAVNADDNSGEGEGEGENPDPTPDPEPEPDPGENTGKQRAIDRILIAIAKDKWIYEDSKIISASLVATLVNNESIAKDLIPELYDKNHMGSKTELEHFDSTNPWTKELPALIDALDELLGLQTAGDDFTFDGDISKEVSGLLPVLNDDADIDLNNPEVETPRTKLRVMYDSVIFRSKITDEVDKALTDDVIDSFVINHVKLDGYYRFEELQALCESAKVLGITSLSEGLTPNNVKDKLTVDNLGTVYGSTIVKGIITKRVQKVIADNGKISDHPWAYENNLKVYRECEIESILVVCDNLDAGEIHLDKVSQCVYKDGLTKSYILVASITDKIIDHKNIIIPHTVVETVEGKQYVNAKELSLAVDAFVAYGIKDFENVTEDMAKTIPEKSIRGDMFKSEIIRARITYHLITLSWTSGGVLAVKLGNAKEIVDVRPTNSVGTTSVATADQLEALAAALEILYEDRDDFQVPVFENVDTILKFSDRIEELCNSDIVLYRICEFLDGAGHGYVHLGTEDAFGLENHKVISGVSTASPEQIIEAAQLIQSLS